MQILDRKRILVIEDDTDIANLLALHLGDLGAEISVATDGHQGLRLSCAKPWDLLLVDIQLPGPNGLDICRAVRKIQSYVPILMLTSRATELDRVLGLDIGADDYMTKPFSIMELIARIKALLRRISAFSETIETPRQNRSIGGLTIDEVSRQVTMQGQPIELTAKEFDLLRYFINHPNRVFKRAELLDKVWGYGHDGYSHTVNSHINRLRGKIELDPTKPRIISTVWGVGYKLDSSQIPK